MNQNNTPPFNNGQVPQTMNQKKSNDTPRMVATGAAILGGAALVGGGAAYAAQHMGRTIDVALDPDALKLPDEILEAAEPAVKTEVEVVHETHVHHHKPFIPQMPWDEPVIDKTFIAEGYVHYTRGGIPMLDVNDILPFDEAFAAAREIIGGPGGVFTWRGGYYGTYTTGEWNSLTSLEKREYIAFVDRQIANDPIAQRMIGREDFTAIQQNLGNEVVVGDDGNLIVMKDGKVIGAVDGQNPEITGNGTDINNNGEVVVVNPEGDNPIEGEIVIDGPGSENIEGGITGEVGGTEGVEIIVDGGEPAVEGEVIVDGGEPAVEGEVIVDGGDIVVDDPSLTGYEPGDDYANVDPTPEPSYETPDYVDNSADYSDPNVDMGTDMGASMGEELIG